QKVHLQPNLPAGYRAAVSPTTRGLRLELFKSMRVVWASLARAVVAIATAAKFGGASNLRGTESASSSTSSGAIDIDGENGHLEGNLAVDGDGGHSSNSNRQIGGTMLSLLSTLSSSNGSDVLNPRSHSPGVGTMNALKSSLSNTKLPTLSPTLSPTNIPTLSPTYIPTLSPTLTLQRTARPWSVPKSVKTLPQRCELEPLRQRLCIMLSVGFLTFSINLTLLILNQPLSVRVNGDWTNENNDAPAGSYFTFDEAEWGAVFGPDAPGFLNARQWRRGSIIWTGAIMVWPELNGVVAHGRREPKGENDWETGDELTAFVPRNEVPLMVDTNWAKEGAPAGGVFTFDQAQWESIFGFKDQEPVTSLKVDQGRAGTIIWSGVVHVWPEVNGVPAHGSKSRGGGEGWESGDELTAAGSLPDFLEIISNVDSKIYI
ncbi:hypothetical protein ACHAWF_005335, partial [Thalassiosira exigua]